MLEALFPDWKPNFNRYRGGEHKRAMKVAGEYFEDFLAYGAIEDARSIIEECTRADELDIKLLERLEQIKVIHVGHGSLRNKVDDADSDVLYSSVRRNSEEIQFT